MVAKTKKSNITGSKKYIDKTVYEMALERLEYTFQEFEKVYFSFSGGKDSSVMLHLALQVARKLGKLPLHVLFIDLEGNYKVTIRHVEEMMLIPDIKAYWICLPLHLRNAVSQYQSQWICWDPKEQEKWIRPLPTYPCVISDEKFFPFFKYGMEFEEFVVKFGDWFAGQSLCACGVGIRSDESLNRFRTIVNKKKRTYANYGWTTQITPHVFNVYPIYDWKTKDIWVANGKFQWKYNHLYDLMYWQGRPLHQQRICQPYGDDQKQGLDLFHECEPETWFKVVNRVPGANMGSLYRGNPLLGNRKTILPENVKTYQEYCILLLASMPRYEAAHFITLIRVFLKWWEDHGVPLSEMQDAADPKLEAKKKIPSWRRVARSLLKNERLCKGLSFNQTLRQYEKWQTFFKHYEQDMKNYDNG